jgi:hypothetical protein
MTPDLVAELMRQLMREAMILAAPLLIAAAALSFALSLVQLAGPVADQRAAAGRNRTDSAGGDALVSGAHGGLHAAAAGRLSSLPGMKKQGTGIREQGIAGKTGDGAGNE